MKVETYEANWGTGDIKYRDVASLSLVGLACGFSRSRMGFISLPGPFPRWKLSRAGSRARQGRDPTGTFWPFWKLIRGLARDKRAPRAIVLENVYGCLTSRNGKDFASIASALAELDYKLGAAVIDAVHFVPQSRPRLFFIAFRGDQGIPASLMAEGPQEIWHPSALIQAHAGVTAAAKKNWIWWRIPRPLKRNSTFAELIEDVPTAVKWHSAAHTNYILNLDVDP